MFHNIQYSGTQEENYTLVIEQLKALVHGEEDLVANLSNASALLNLFLDDINWVGFYLAKDDQLVLGPFQGLPACIRIPFHKGVCGYAATNRETIVVPDVHAFKGHIACDGATNSEIVVPMIHNNQLIGVLDIDSPSFSRFTQTDADYLEQFVKVIVNTIEPSI